MLLYVNMSTSEIFIILDGAGRFGLNYKSIEQGRIDERVSSVNHEYVTFTDEMQADLKDFALTTKLTFQVKEQL